jgi:hypothetical protein
MGVVRSCVMLPPDVSSPSNSSRSIGVGRIRRREGYWVANAESIKFTEAPESIRALMYVVSLGRRMRRIKESSEGDDSLRETARNNVGRGV